MQFITRPLETWPRPQTKNRRNSPYKVGYVRILQDLEYELGKVGATGTAVLQLDIYEDTRLRSDGTPFSDDRVKSPRVAIAFNCRHGPLKYFCDRFTHWQGNLRAIALGLQRLRLVEDTGITTRGEQYTGFKALPPGIPLGPAAMTVEQAARVLLKMAGGTGEGDGVILRERESFEWTLRRAQKRHHPDAGGRADDFLQVQAAGEVLKKHFEGSRR